MLLISDAPFRNRQQQFILLRVGKRDWMGGQLLYILFTSVAFTAVLCFCPGFFCCRTWSGEPIGARF